MFLVDQIAELPRPLRITALAAFALHEEAHHRFLHERMAWLAKQLNRDSGKTASRWVEKAFNRLAGIIDQRDGDWTEGDRNEYAPNGWRVETLDAFVDLTANPVQLFEVREIVATADELDELLLSISVPNLDPQNPVDHATASMRYGGTIVDEVHDPSGHSQFIVRLPRPLRLGETHSYGIEFTSCARDLLTPYYVMLPLRRVRSFRARLRFGQDAPKDLWRLKGVPPVVLEKRTPGADRLSLDENGEVSVEFFNLREGLGYGIAWAPATTQVTHTEDPRYRA